MTIRRWVLVKFADVSCYRRPDSLLASREPDALTGYDELVVRARDGHRP